MARKKQPKPKAVHQLTAAQFDALFQTPDDCIRYLVARRWPEAFVVLVVVLPTRLSRLDDMEWKWQCYHMHGRKSYRFSHLTGTIFENTNKPLRDWYKVIHLMLVSKKGMSALQIYRYMGFGSYRLLGSCATRSALHSLKTLRSLVVSSR